MVRVAKYAMVAAPLVAVCMLGIVVLRERKREASLQVRLASAEERLGQYQRQVRHMEEESKLLRQAETQSDHESVSGGIRGVIPSGNDLGEPREVFVSEAVELCKALAGCEGFTFKHKDKFPGEPVAVFFKSKTVIDEAATEWWAFRVRVEHPMYPLLEPFRPFIKADYDYDAVARYGPELQQHLWPEFRVPKSHPAFSYPAPTMLAVPLSMAPRVYLLPNMVTNEEAAEIVAASKENLRRSLVARGPNDKEKDSKDKVRTSSGAWLGDSVQAVRKLRDKIQERTGVARHHFEQLQILRYEEGQKYGSHVDYFHPAAYGKQDWNRMATVITYLNNVTHGGESSFPTAHMAHRTGHGDCDRGLRVAPVQGTGVLFYSMRPNFNFDPFSLHSGCPVGPNEQKWVAVQWLRLPLPADGPQPHN